VDAVSKHGNLADYLLPAALGNDISGIDNLPGKDNQFLYKAVHR
jgi:hypothetical protein